MFIVGYIPERRRARELQHANLMTTWETTYAPCNRRLQGKNEDNTDRNCDDEKHTCALNSYNRAQHNHTCRVQHTKTCRVCTHVVNTNTPTHPKLALTLISVG